MQSCGLWGIEAFRQKVAANPKTEYSTGAKEIVQVVTALASGKLLAERGPGHEGYASA